MMRKTLSGILLALALSVSAFSQSQKFELGASVSEYLDGTPDQVAKSPFLMRRLFHYMKNSLWAAGQETHDMSFFTAVGDITAGRINPASRL